MPHGTSLYSKLKLISTHSPPPPPPPPRLFRARGHLCFQGRYFHIRRSLRVGPHIKFGGKIWGKIRRAKFTKYEEKFGKFCYHKMQKLGKNPNFGVKSEIQRAKFGVFVTYICGGKIWGSK